MHHLEFLKSNGHHEADLARSASGRYYTGELIGRRLVIDAVELYYSSKTVHTEISVLEPFAGDGRLVAWFIEEWLKRGYPQVAWNIELWEQDRASLKLAKKQVKAAAGEGVKVAVKARAVDSFRALRNAKAFDIVLTNPPWDVIKPDRRELSFLSDKEKASYVDWLRNYDDYLKLSYPLSQPKVKFAGWGTNLSRVGLEASLGALRGAGICGIVLPASFAADSQSSSLRAWVLENFCIDSIVHYPAEANQFDGADTGAVAVCIKRQAAGRVMPFLGRYSIYEQSVEGGRVELVASVLSRTDFVLPVTVGNQGLEILSKMSSVGTVWADLESAEANRLWAGREIDETRIGEHLVDFDHSLPGFLKGRMIDRFASLLPSHSLVKPGWKAPKSTRSKRIAWRDVSRPSQMRRMIATLIDPGTVAGNSLGVACFDGESEVATLCLLGIMNSTSFETQLRAGLATGHISLSTLRRMYVPTYDILTSDCRLAALVDDALQAGDSAASQVDAYVAAKIYNLGSSDYQWILSQFSGLSDVEKGVMLQSHNEYWNWK